MTISRFKWIVAESVHSSNPHWMYHTYIYSQACVCVSIPGGAGEGSRSQYQTLEQPQKQNRNDNVQNCRRECCGGDTCYKILKNKE